MESELDTQSSISSIDIDPKGKYLIAGGREILKLIDLDQGANVNSRKMNIKLNLRRQGTKLAIGYVEFNKKKENLLLAASVQGNFQIWDIEKPKETFNKRDHSQAIHRMNWQNENCFISGGQDYQIFYYDLRKPDYVFSLSRSDAIRDIKFNISDPNYFMAASDSGLLEYFDIRNINSSVSEAKCWKQNSSTNLIICLDWAQNNIFASGSNDKEIKIWQVDNHTEIREKAIIQHIDGSSHIKWHKKNPSYLSVSSLNRDISVTTYDIRTPYRPISILKGHNDIITSFVFNNDETQVVTGSKDKYLRMQPIANAFEVYKNCPIFPVAFNQYNDLIMKLESPNFVFTEFDKFYQNTQYSMNSQNMVKQSSHEDSIFKAKTSNFPMVSSSNNEIQKSQTGPALTTQSKLGSRALFYVEAIDQKFDDKKPPFDVEIDYLQNHYNSKKDFLTNSKVAQDLQKNEIAHYWKALDHLINDLYGLGKEFNNPGVLVCPISTPKQQNDQSDDDQKSPLETPIQQIKNKFQDRRQTNQLDWQDIQKLYKYFEKYPAAFKQELDSKNIIIEDQNHLKIHIERIPYYKTLLRTMTPMGQLLTDKKQMMKVISNSILQLIQHVIDLGELPSGFWMAACAKNFVSFPEAIATKWTQSYIDLLVSFGKHSFAMKVALESPVEKFRNSNKYRTDYKCLGACKLSSAALEKSDEEKNQPFCLGCKTDFLCALCFLPVRGLYLWCQHCMHGGHMKEMKTWFNKNTQCPLGCGHNCFEK